MNSYCTYCLISYNTRIQEYKIFSSFLPLQPGSFESLALTKIRFRNFVICNWTSHFYQIRLLKTYRAIFQVFYSAFQWSRLAWCYHQFRPCIVDEQRWVLTVYFVVIFCNTITSTPDTTCKIPEKTYYIHKCKYVVLGQTQIFQPSNFFQ